MMSADGDPRMVATLPPEQAERLARWNDTAHPYPDPALVHQLFDARADAHPDRVALISGAEALTFGEVQRRANALAHLLVERGVGPGVPVGVALPRSFEAIIGMLAIIKAGGPYLPLDPSYPVERLRQMVEDAAVRIVLTSDAVGPLPLADTETIDVARVDLSGRPETSPPITGTPDAALYVVFTSGSTGRPNGVLGTHRGAINRFSWAWETMPFSDGEVCCQKTSLNFVDHVAETWAPLLQGHPLVIVPDAVIQDGGRFVDLLAEHRIERLVAVPSLMATLLRAVPDIGRKLAHLRFCTLSGERLTTELAREFMARMPDTVLINIYGMSEAAADATWYDQRWASPSDSVPIGRPMFNTQVHVLDEQRRPVPIGEPGELYLAGAGLALGYIGQPELTSRRFVPNPFADTPGARMYRSGDMGRWLPDGTLQFIGRVDHQVKVRGVRIELGEVEAAARSLDEVADAVVVAPEFGGDRRLVAYLTTTPGATAGPGAIRGALADRLPDTMVPARIILLDRFPLTPNGKIDRSALPDPVGPRPAVDTVFAPARTSAEREIVRIWQELLFVDQVGIHDSFFDLGGDSLLVVMLRARLNAAFGVSLAAHQLYEHRTVKELAALVTDPGRVDADQPAEALRLEPVRSVASRTTDVAIIGMAGRFPGAPDLEGFWELLVNGVEGLRRLTDEELRTWEPDHEEKAADPDFIPVAGTLDDVELFDAEFFGIQPGEARTLDPQHRIWFETAWQALEHGGYAPGKTSERIGVFAGAYMNTYAMHNLLPDRASVDEFVRLHGAASLMQSLNNEPDYLPTRTSHLLDLRGPSINVQTACSTSLVAVALACRSIASGDCDLALAGGVTVLLPQAQGYYYQAGGIRSVDGHCRPFDAKGSGTIFTSGVGAVLLKGLDQAVADGDTIHAVIKGAGINNDGAHKASYMAPSVDGQAEVIVDAQRRGGVAPDTIDYVEAHGTATPLGDPIEIAALTRAFRQNGADPAHRVALGSVKGNIGHTDAAAGVAGLLKTVLSLDHEAIPPTLHFATPNPEIDFEATPFHVPTTVQPWRRNGKPRRAAVSSFGVGGTNAHVVIEEAPLAVPEPSGRPRFLLPLSARSETALGAVRRRLADHLEARRPVLADVAHTLTVGRADLPFRASVVAATVEEAIEALRADPSAASRLEIDSPEVVMLFPGQGSQFVGMGRELYDHEPTFRAVMDRCAEILEPLLGLDLREILYPADEGAPGVAERLTMTGLAQPAIFAVSYALAQLWRSWGVRPSVLVGHSVGEYVAGAVAGVFSLEDALAIIAARARLMQDLPGGSMRAVRLSPDELAPYLVDGVSLAAVNTPRSSVVSGPTDAIARFEARMQEAGLETIELHTSHAFHSAMMDPILDPFRAVIAGVERRAPSIPIVSTVTGKPLTDAEAIDPDYWAGQVRRPVRFSDAVLTLQETLDRVYLEVGPGITLSTAVRQHPDGHVRVAVIDSLGHPSKRLPSLQPVLEALGRLWQAGVAVDRLAWLGGERRSRIPLPTYPFERKRHWVDAPPLASAASRATSSATGPADLPATPPSPSPSPSPVSADPDRTEEAHPDRLARIGDQLVAIIAELSGLDASTLDRKARFADLGLDSLFLNQANSRFRKAFGVRVPLRSLLNEASTVDALAARFDAELPPDATAAPTPATVPVTPVLPAAERPTMASRSVVTETQAMVSRAAAARSAVPSEVDRLIGEQLRVMEEQLRLMNAQLQLLDRTLDPGPRPITVVGSEAVEIGSARPVPVAVLPNVSRFLVERHTPHAERWNLDALLTPTRRLDPELVRRVVGLMLERHDALRLRFTIHPDRPTAAITPEADPPFRVCDLSALDASERCAAIERRAEAIQSGFSLDGPLLHVELFELGDQGQRLLVVAHHFVMDRLSWTPFWSDFEALYTALEQGATPALPPVTTTFRDWAEALQHHVDSPAAQDGIPFWRSLPWSRVRPIPLDHPEGVNTNASSDTILLVLDREETDRVLRRTPAVARKVDLLLTALGRTIAAWTGDDTVLMDMMGHGRDDGIAAGADPLDTIGFFISYTPILLRFQPGADPVTLTDQIEPLIRRGLDVDLLRTMASDPAIRAEFGALPRAQVLFNHHGHREDPVEVPRSPLLVAASESRGSTHAPDGLRHHPIAISSDVHHGELRFNFVYSTNLHDRATIAALVEQFHRELLALAGPAGSPGPGLASGAAAAEPDRHGSVTTTAAPSSAGRDERSVSDALVAMLCSLGALDPSTFDRTARFADLGLDSLFLTQFGSLVRKQLGVRVKLTELLDTTPTVESLARQIVVGGDGASDAPEPQPTPAPAEEQPSADASPVGPFVIPLTTEQRDIWLGAQRSDEASAAFNLQALLTLTGPLDIDALRWSLAELVGRHEALRTTFEDDGETQVIHPGVAIELTLLDVSDDAEPVRTQRMDARLDADLSTPYDLATGPLLRVTLVRRAADDHVLSLSMHHLVGDGWSFDVMRRELGILYAGRIGARPADLEPPTPYRSYVGWRAQQIADSQAYWRRLHDTQPIRLDLPTDHERPPYRTFAYDGERAVVTGDLLAGIRARAAAQRVTVFAVLLSAWEILLHELSGQPDFLHLVFVAGQPGMGVEGLVGYCTRSLPMRARRDPGERVADRLVRSGRATMDALDHRYVALEQLADELRMPPVPGRPPFGSTGMTLETALRGIEFGGLEASGWDRGRRQYGFFDLELYLTEAIDSLTVDLEYASTILDAQTIRRWLAAYLDLLGEIVARPDALVADLHGAAQARPVT